MAVKIATNTVRLRYDAELVLRYVGEIESQASQMQTSLAELDSMWDGPGSEEFKRVFHEDMAVVASVIKGLKSIYNYEENARIKYEDCENRVAALVNEINI